MSLNVRYNIMMSRLTSKKGVNFETLVLALICLENAYRDMLGELITF